MCHFLDHAAGTLLPLLTRQTGNLQGVAAFQISNLRQMLWIASELWLSAVVTLTNGFQLSRDTSAK